MGETKDKQTQKISEVRKQSENHGVSPERKTVKVTII